MTAVKFTFTVSFDFICLGERELTYDRWQSAITADQEQD